MRRFFVWWAVLIVIVIAAGGYFLLRTPYREWRTLAGTAKLEAALVVAEQQFKQLQSEASDWRAIEQSRGNQLDLMLPAATDIPNLLTQLEAVARSARFSIDAVAVAEPAAGARTARASASGLRPLQVTLNISGGSYAQLKDLLDALQHSWRVVQVDSFGVGGGETSFHLELTAFYYPR